jgi:hypothetical protein
MPSSGILGHVVVFDPPQDRFLDWIVAIITIASKSLSVVDLSIMDRRGFHAGAKGIPPSDRLEIELTRLEIAAGDFQLSQSIREVIFLAPSFCRTIHGFDKFLSLFRIVIPRSVEVIDELGFSGCRSLTEVTL